MSLSIASSSSVSSVTLALYRSESAAPRRGPAGDDGPRADRRDAATPLATAMAEALRTLGWTPQAPAPAPAPAAPATGTNGVTAPDATAPAEESTGVPAAAPETDDTPADLPAAMAGFAEALMAALREAGGSQGRGRDRDGDGLRDNGDNGRRAWGYGRAVGVIAMRLEQVIGELKAALPAPAPTPTPVTDPAPAPVTEPAPTPTVDAAAPAPEAAAAAAEPATVAPAPSTPVPGDAPVLDAAPAPAPAPASSPLADAFAQLLDALRDNGADVPADGDPAAQMIDFLQTLSGGLKPEGGGTTTVTGLFIRVSA
jgi:hypothetical protein